MSKNEWTTSHTETTSAKPKAIWQHWTNVQDWPKEDKNLESAKLEGDFAVGSYIVMKPKGSPKSKVKITKVIPFEFYSTQGSIPFGKLLFTHKVSEEKGKTSFTHTITVTGPMRGIFVNLVAKKLAKDLPVKMKNIAELAEKE